jgi:hypothetical protein
LHALVTQPHRYVPVIFSESSLMAFLYTVSRSGHSRRVFTLVPESMG